MAQISDAGAAIMLRLIELGDQMVLAAGVDQGTAAEWTGLVQELIRLRVVSFDVDPEAALEDAQPAAAAAPPDNLLAFPGSATA